ncbi:MAG: glycosyltransferase [Deltaproteobacteria bacterium]|nr:glycosyltransferase [Deltaproteobacteria bacterium]
MSSDGPSPKHAMKRILYILHCYNNRGGTEEHTKTLAAGLDGSYETAILYPENGELHLRRTRTGATESFPAETVPFPVTPYRVASVDSALQQALRKFRPDIIHIQHFIYWPLSLIADIGALGVPVVLSFHDYYLLSPNFTLLFAERPEDSWEEQHVIRLYGANISEYILERRDVLQRDIVRIKNRIVPSLYLQKFLSIICGLSSQVIPHGIVPFPAPAPRPRDGFIRFGCVSSLLPQKGWRVLLDAFALVHERHRHTELHFFGGGEQPPAVAPPGVTFHGKYDVTDLSGICGQFDVGVIPSIFRENYSLELSELWHARKPVVASRIGALAERIQDGINGRLADPASPESMAEALESFVTTDDWRAWQLPQVRLVDEMLDAYRTYYSAL